MDTESSFEDDENNEQTFENVEVLEDDSSDDQQEMEEVDPITEKEGVPEPSSSLFGCRMLAFVREFKGQSSGAHIAYWDVQAKSVNDFKHKLWNLAKSHLLREVVFNQCADGNTVPAWSDKETPDECDFSKFAVFYEKQNRKYTQMDKLTSNVLQNWKGKEIQLLLHVYSLSVSSRKIFTTVKQNLIDPSDRDKSGAASTQLLVQLSEDLRNEHGDRWDAHEIVWKMWASAIQASPAHMREHMMNSAPPEHLQHLFKAKEGTRIQNIKRGLAIAHNVNATFREEIAAAKEAFLAMETTEQNLRLQMSQLKLRIEALEQRERVGESFLDAMETSVTVADNEFSQSIAGRVTDMKDIDHE